MDEPRSERGLPVLGGDRYGYEDDVYGSCSCGDTARHRHEHQRDATGVCWACNRCSDPMCCGPTDEPCTGAQGREAQ